MWNKLMNIYLKYNMKVFITGGTGYIGSYLIKHLIDSGHELLCLKRPNSNLDRLSNYKDKVIWVNNNENWQDKFRSYQPYIVYNLAWNGVSSSDRIIWEKQVQNICLQQELLDLSLECNVQKFVGIGSQSEYGDFQNIVDENYPINPKTAYAAAKCASLTIMKTFCEINHIDWYWFRVFPIFGPGESENWLIPQLIKTICTNGNIDLTPGEQKLPYLYVGECANAIASPIDVTGCSGIYNISSDNPMPLKDLICKIRDMINPNFNLNFGSIPYRFGQSMLMGGDTTSLSKNLYHLQTNSFEEKLKETVNYYVNKFSK